ncbi:MAG TPA: hypothetical protein VIK18_24495 [Pirellulales bacterium]
MERTYAAYLGLVAFVAAIADGWLHGGSTSSVLWHAWFSLLAFVIVGFLAGLIAGRMVDEAIRGRAIAEMAAREQAPAQTAKPGTKKP